jgi:hypothetical protein
LKKDVEGCKLSGKPMFDSKQVDAVTGLAQFLLKATTDGYRRRELERTIDAQNESVKTVTTALKAIVGHDYEGRLDNEKIALDAFKKRLDRAERASDQPVASEKALGETQESLKTTTSVTVEIGRREVQEHLREIATKREAADSYVKSLDLIAKGHQELFDHKKDLGSKDLAKLLWDDASEMISQIHNIQKAF